MKIRILAMALAIGCAAPPVWPVWAQTSAVQHRQVELEALLAADRAFAAAAEHQPAPTSLAAMFDADVIFTSEGGRLFRGRAAVAEAIAHDPAMADARVSWQPVRGGISADGLHGFSYGFLSSVAANGKAQPFKYLAYWIRLPEGWRVAGYKYARRPAGASPAQKLAPITPKRAVDFDPSGSDHHATGLTAAEKGFSDDAQTIGLAAAFAKHGGPESMNLGREPGFILGSDNIAHKLFGAPKPGSLIEWSSDGVLVASSGDLGLSWGHIRLKNTTRLPIAFFTIWRRGSPEESWRYIAE